MSQLRDRLAEINRSHRWIVAADVAAAATETVGTLRGDGAGEIFVVSATEGVGELPSAVPVFYTRTSGETIMGAMRAYLASIAEPSPRLLAAVDDFDPVGNALAITPPFHTASSAAGRAVYGGRRPEWAKLEDKTVVAPIWDAAGIARAPSAVVSLADAAAAAAALGGPLGTVWVADNTEGWHGGGDYTRWIRNPGDVTAALDWFEDRAVRVRVMPFLDGIPCSIHGYVASDGIAAFRPVEMVVLRRRNEPELFYGGTSTFWDPPTVVRDEMRRAARSVAAVLADSVGYRGPFSIDGVCTTEGFLPTELNPRLSAGLILLARAASFPLDFVTRAFLAGDVSVDASWLEDGIVPGADAVRTGGAGFSVRVEIPEDATGIAFAGDAAVAVDPDAAEGIIEVGSSPMGTYIRMRLDPDRIPPGPSVAPLAAAAARFANERWDAGLPELEPAPDPFR